MASVVFKSGVCNGVCTISLCMRVYRKMKSNNSFRVGIAVGMLIFHLDTV